MLRTLLVVALGPCLAAAALVQPGGTTSRRTFALQAAGGVAAAALPLSAVADEKVVATSKVGVTPGGVKYFVKESGSCSPFNPCVPQQGDIVKIKYKAYLSNGKMFDSSEGPGRKPIAAKYKASPPQLVSTAAPPSAAASGSYALRVLSERPRPADPPTLCLRFPRGDRWLRFASRHPPVSCRGGRRRWRRWSRAARGSSRCQRRSHMARRGSRSRQRTARSSTWCRPTSGCSTRSPWCRSPSRRRDQPPCDANLCGASLCEARA